MKNSSVETTAPKLRGPLRTGFLIPSLILVAVVGLFFKLFFDDSLRRTFEFIGTNIHGAEVDVADVHTSFIGASISIRGIEVTDKEKPGLNVLKVGEVRFAMSWAALLRAKVLIEEASVLDIEIYSPRRSPGYVVPPPPPTAPHQGPSSIDQAREAVLAQAQKEYNGNFLGDVARLLGGGGGDVKAQLASLEGQLKSDAKIKETQKDLDEKRAKWQARLKTLPQDKEFQAYAAQVKALKFDLHNPAELARNIQAAQKIIKDAGEKVQVIGQAQKELQSDLSSTSQQYKDIEKLVQEDVRALQMRLKLPNVDGKEFSEQLFMSMVEKRLGSMAKYVTLIRHYMPAGKSASNPPSGDLAPPKRGHGKTYRFPVTSGYPLFWLKHAKISSQSKINFFMGDVKGEITDLTTEPALAGRPTLILAHGDFRNQSIYGVEARVSLDHTTDTPRDSIEFKVARFLVTPLTLANSPEVQLGMGRARGQTEMTGTLTGDQVELKIRTVFSEVDWKLEAKNNMVHDLIENVLKGVPSVELNAEITGSLNHLATHITSNLGEDFAKGIGRQLQAKIDSARSELKKAVDEKIGGDRSKLKTDLDHTTGELTQDLDGKKSEADKAIKDAQNEQNGAKKNSQKSLQEEGKKLLKKFNLGG